MSRALARLFGLITASLVLLAMCLLSVAPAQARADITIPTPGVYVNFGSTADPTAAPAPAPVVNLEEFELQVMQSINEVRTAAGLHPIRYFNTCVDKLSEDWANHITSTGILEHRDQNVVLKQCRQAWAGEDLVRGTLLTPKVIVDAWMASTSHRKVLLKKRANHAGIAISLDGQGRYVGVLNFSDPS